MVSQEEILGVMMVEAGVASPVQATRRASPHPHPHSAPSKPSMTMRARLTDNKNTARMTTTARIHSRSSGSLALDEADYEHLEPETSSDGGGDEEGGAMSRPRGHSSTMESREMRRSSLGEMSADEERGRCFTGAKPDMMLGVERDTRGVERESPEGGEGGTRDGSRQGARTGASWKWDFKGWTQAGGGGGSNTNGVVMGPKARAKK